MPFIEISPNSGNGNGTVSLGADNYTGRDNRIGTVRFQVTTGDMPYMDVAVTQLGLGDVLEMDTGASFSLGDEGGRVVISGSSNLRTIRLTNLTAAGVTRCSFSINSGGEQSAAISGGSVAFTVPGDPGASGIYEYSITLTIGANTGSSGKSTVIKLTNGSNISHNITINQEAGNYLNVSPESLTFTADGGTKQITIDTNESWTIE